MGKKRGSEKRSSTVETDHASSSKSLKNESKANLKKRKIYKEKSEEDDEDEQIVSKNEIKELKKSMKELSEAMKKLQEILLTKADLLEVSLRGKETQKKKEEEIDTCGFECEEAAGNNYQTTCGFECEEAAGNNYGTIFVKGFQHLRPREEIKNALSNIFGSCGEITRVFVPIECETGVPLGFAFIDLDNDEATEKALELSGSYMGGRKLEVTMAIDRDEYYGFTNFNGCKRCARSLDHIYNKANINVNSWRM